MLFDPRPLYQLNLNSWVAHFFSENLPPVWFPQPQFSFRLPPLSIPKILVPLFKDKLIYLQLTFICLHRKWSYLIKARGGTGSFLHVWLIWKYFYRWTGAFYGMKLPCRVKKLSIFEDRPLANSSIEICRRNFVNIWSFWSILFLSLTLDAQKYIEIVESN